VRHSGLLGAGLRPERLIRRLRLDPRRAARVRRLQTFGLRSFFAVPLGLALTPPPRSSRRPLLVERPEAPQFFYAGGRGGGRLRSLRLRLFLVGEDVLLGLGAACGLRLCGRGWRIARRGRFPLRPRRHLNNGRVRKKKNRQHSDKKKINYCSLVAALDCTLPSHDKLARSVTERRQRVTLMLSFEGSFGERFTFEEFGSSGSR
jgi:hypothetical protein